MGNLSRLIARGTVQIGTTSVDEAVSAAISCGSVFPFNGCQIQVEIPIHTNTIGNVGVNIYTVSKVVATARSCLLTNYTILGNNVAVVSHAKNVMGMYVGTENQIILGMYGSAEGDAPLIAFAIFAL